MKQVREFNEENNLLEEYKQDVTIEKEIEINLQLKQMVPLK